MGTTLQLLRLSDREAQRLLANPGEDDDFIDREDHPTVDVDKAWDGLSFLQSKVAGSSGKFLVEGGRAIGRWNWFGPRPRLARPSEVEFSSRLLDSVPEGRLRAAYDPKAMIRRRVYPNIWSVDPSDTDAIDYLMGFYDDVRTFVSETARVRDAMILDLG